MKKIRYVLMGACIVAMAMSGCALAGSSETAAKSDNAAKAAVITETTAVSDAEAAAGTEKNYAKITIKDYGTITVELDADHAPITVENFKKLASEGFYDGLTFHRIISGFMIQGGDPQGTGLGGAKNTIKGEFSNNGVDNPLSHTRGAISMARSKDKDSASSQFFLVHQDSIHLDGDYAAFGYVTEGMEVVDKICEMVKAKDNNGKVAVEDQPIIEKVEIFS